MFEVQGIHLIEAGGDHGDMRVAVVMPTGSEADDSARIALGLGFGEPLEHTIAVAGILAARTNHPVIAYERSMILASDQPSAISYAGRDALEAADDFGQELFTNTERRIVSVHSLGGHAVGHLAGDQPDRFDVIQLTKAIGTTTVHHDPEMSYLDQLVALDEKSSSWAGMAMMMRFANPSHVASLIPHLASRQLSEATRHGAQEFASKWGSHGLRRSLARAAVSRGVDIAPTLILARKHASIGAIGDKSDRILPSREMRASLVGRGLVDNFVLVDTGHVPLATKAGARDVEAMADQIVLLEADTESADAA